MSDNQVITICFAILGNGFLVAVGFLFIANAIREKKP